MNGLSALRPVLARPEAGAILGAALLSFSLSFDDFIVTNFNHGNTITFPMYVWGSAQRGIPPQVNVVGTVMFLLALLLVLGSGAVQRRRERAVS